MLVAISVEAVGRERCFGGGLPRPTGAMPDGDHGHRKRRGGDRRRSRSRSRRRRDHRSGTSGAAPPSEWLGPAAVAAPQPPSEWRGPTGADWRGGSPSGAHQGGGGIRDFRAPRWQPSGDHLGGPSLCYAWMWAVIATLGVSNSLQALAHWLYEDWIATIFYTTIFYSTTELGTTCIDAGIIARVCLEWNASFHIRTISPKFGPTRDTLGRTWQSLAPDFDEYKGGFVFFSGEFAPCALAEWLARRHALEPAGDQAGEGVPRMLQAWVVSAARALHPWNFARGECEAQRVPPLASARPSKRLNPSFFESMVPNLAVASARTALTPYRCSGGVVFVAR